jgi:hypothetical protein
VVVDAILRYHIRDDIWIWVVALARVDRAFVLGIETIVIHKSGCLLHRSYENA